jgi:pyruvate dehydrogenase E2 component (dihydrolipoamide acetyltransferase)
MAYDLKLPDIGEGVAEGEIVRWLVKEGDRVVEDQPMVEVMTDKASVEIPSPRTGTVASIRAAEGQMVPVGTVIVSIAEESDTVASATGGAGGSGGSTAAAGPGRSAGARTHSPADADEGARSATAHLAVAPPIPPALGKPVQATPAVRNLAKQMNVLLENIKGTGPGGTVTAEDVKSAANAGTSTPTTAAKADEPEERVALRGLRRKIAEHMRRSMSTAATFTFVAECDFTAILEHRQSVKAEAEKGGFKLTFLPYILRAVVEPLKQFPLLNSSLDDERQEIVVRRYYHLGVATHTEEGLTVPILHHADRLGLFALAREIERLANAARNHKLKVEELQGGTFTITSTGALGGVLATPILHHPQVAILGVHEVKRRPAVVDDQIVIRSLGNLSLSLDHRVVDGAIGAEFLYALVERLQNPQGWITPGDLQ